MFRKVVSFFKKNILGIIIGGVIFGSVSVLAATYFPSNQVTYDNGTSGLSSNNVQGAIDELYNNINTKCSSGLTVNVAGKNIEIVASCPQKDSCSGLFQDANDKNRFIYRGATPNNYLTFNGEEAGWRIISYESDKTLKIIRDTSIGKMQWNSDTTEYYNTIWENATLKTYLNETYYNSLNDTAKKQIINHDFETYNPVYNDTRIWNGNIGLATTDDLSHATSKLHDCEGASNFHYNSCEINNWLDNHTDWWTMTSIYQDRDDVYGFNATISYVVSMAGFRITEEYNVRPVLYLSSNIKITGGDGSKNNPFELSL